jgi:hypothetical protein
LNNDLLIGPDTAKQRKNYFVDSINMYLNHLDNCLDLLVRNEALSEINDCILDADKFYERNVRAKFLKFQLWVSDRPHILIQEKTGLRMLSLGIQGAKKGRLSTREALKIITHLINRHINSMQLGNFLHERKSTLAIEELISFEKKLWKSDGRPSKRLCQEFIRVLKCPDQLKMWSIELSEFDPLHNQFRELLFVYE